MNGKRYKVLLVFVYLGTGITQKDNMIAEQNGMIKQLQDENIILQNINKVQPVKA